MNFAEALDVLRSGGKVTRNGRIFILRRGLLDVTGEEIQQYYVSEEDRAADNWEAVAEPGGHEATEATEATDASVGEVDTIIDAPIADHF